MEDDFFCNTWSRHNSCREAAGVICLGWWHDHTRPTLGRQGLHHRLLHAVNLSKVRHIVKKKVGRNKVGPISFCTTLNLTPVSLFPSGSLLVDYWEEFAQGWEFDIYTNTGSTDQPFNSAEFPRINF